MCTVVLNGSIGINVSVAILFVNGSAKGMTSVVTMHPQILK